MQIAIVPAVIMMMLLVSSDAGPVAGGGCFTACFSACAAMGPGKFAAVVGIVFDIAGCAAMCGPVCAMGLAIPGICFDTSTTFSIPTVSNPTSALEFAEIAADGVKAGYQIVTLSSNGQPMLANVTAATVIPGDFNFVEMHFVSKDTNITQTLTVTTNHGVIVVDPNNVYNSNDDKIIPAGNVTLGQVMRGKHNTLFTVVSTHRLNRQRQHFIQTDVGTVLASGILTSTSCVHDDAISTQNLSPIIDNDC